MSKSKSYFGIVDEFGKCDGFAPIGKAAGRFGDRLAVGDSVLIDSDLDEPCFPGRITRVYDCIQTGINGAANFVYVSMSAALS